MTTKILFDTDIGSDIDDAVCLAYLLANPACDLMGITTVAGEPVKRAQLASALCRAAGQEIPIYPGAEHPLLGVQKQPGAAQAAALVKWPHEQTFPDGEAISFMRRTIRQHPGEIVLLAVGPITNLALLFTMDPELPKLLKGLVLMCGVFTRKLPNVGPLEWNAMCDPHATAIVYQHDAPLHRSVGLDVTTQVTMHADKVRRRFQTRLLNPVLDFAEVWFKGAQRITFHDPLAAVTIFDDNVCRFSQGTVSVELTSPRLAGLTYLDENVSDPRHEVAMTVDTQRFFDHYFSVFD